MGRKFALVELVAFFVTILRRGRLKLGDGLDAGKVERILRRKGGGSVTLSPPMDVKVVLVKRESGVGV